MMMDNPLVSIIVPVFRKEKFLEECLASIAGQTFSDWNCIIVDDGSDQPDLIYKICNKTLGKKGKVIHQQNQGTSAARNRGIDEARGEFILCLDADDCLHQDFLLKLTSLLIKNTDIGVAFCWTQHFGHQNHIANPSRVDLFWLLQRNLIPVTSLFRKEIWSQIGGFDEQMKIGHEDWEFWIRVSLAKYHFRCCPEPLFFYRIASDSKNVGATKRRVETIHYIRHKYPTVFFMGFCKLITNPEFQGIPRKALVRLWFTSLFFHYSPSFLRKNAFSVYQLFKD